MKLKISYAILCELVLIVSLAAPAQAQHGAIKGKVKEQGGKALEGVSIRAVNAADKQDTHEVKTDSKGEFEVSGLRTGDYILTFEQSGFRTFTTRRIDVENGKTTKLNRAVELMREGAPYALVRGAVFTDAGFTLPNATVTIERIGGNKGFKKESTSGEGGAFTFRLPAEKATYRITATARGFQPSSKEVEVDGDELHNVALSLERIK